VNGSGPSGAASDGIVVECVHDCHPVATIAW
jgi:hypothetical protein